jgi:hypothetical protein
VHVGRRELLADGAPVLLGGRAFEIVEVLVRSANRLVTKDDLMGRIRPGSIVSAPVRDAAPAGSGTGPLGLRSTSLRMGLRTQPVDDCEPGHKNRDRKVFDEPAIDSPSNRRSVIFEPQAFSKPHEQDETSVHTPMLSPGRSCPSASEYAIQQYASHSMSHTS